MGNTRMNDQCIFMSPEAKIINIKEELGTGAGLRSTSQPIRERISAEICKGNSIIIDLKDIQVMNSSFADEIFAKIISEIGIEKFKSKVKIKNANDLVKKIINFCINARLQSQ